MTDDWWFPVVGLPHLVLINFALTGLLNEREIFFLQWLICCYGKVDLRIVQRSDQMWTPLLGFNDYGQALVNGSVKDVEQDNFGFGPQGREFTRRCWIPLISVLI